MVWVRVVNMLGLWLWLELTLPKTLCLGEWGASFFRVRDKVRDDL